MGRVAKGSAESKKHTIEGVRKRRKRLVDKEEAGKAPASRPKKRSKKVKHV